MPPSRPTPNAPPARTPRGDATRERLLEAAVELLETGGYAAASVASISARAGVAAGALYRHFPSKAELIAEVFRAVAERELAELYEASAAPGTALEKLDAVVRRFAGSALENRRLAWALVYEPVDPLIDAERLAYRQTYRERLADLLRIAIEAGEVPDQDADLTVGLVDRGDQRGAGQPALTREGQGRLRRGRRRGAVGILPARGRRPGRLSLRSRSRPRRA